MFFFRIASAFALAINLLPAAAPGDEARDLKIQGEYTGTSISPSGSESSLAAQVVALDQGDFKVVFYPGGLPGAGWSGKDRTETEAHTAGDRTEIAGDPYHGRIDGDSLIGSNSAGDGFRLAKRHRTSPSLGLPRPSGAVVLFDGTSLDQWTNAIRDTNGNLKPLEREGVTRKLFSDFSLHVEYQMPFLPFMISAARGNSGLRFFDDHHFFAEIQILDSFGGLPGSEECGGLESQFAPLVMAAFPPLAWQTLDVQLTTPPQADTPFVGNAVITVWLNGILIHPGRTLSNMGPRTYIGLQSLDSLGAFRNVWLLEGNDHYEFFPGAGLSARHAGARASSTRRSGPLLSRPRMPGIYRADGVSLGQDPLPEE